MERWQQIESLFQAALERDPAERYAYLREACQGDSDLRREVASLLANHQAATDSRPWAAAAAAKLIDGPASLEPGQCLGPYRIECFLAAGGMGEVYRYKVTALERITAIEVATSKRGLTQTGTDGEKWSPKTRDTADHSMPYLVARAMFDGNITNDSYVPEKLKEPRILAFMQKIKVVEDPAFTARAGDSPTPSPRRWRGEGASAATSTTFLASRESRCSGRTSTANSAAISGGDGRARRPIRCSNRCGPWRIRGTSARYSRS